MDCTLYDLISALIDSAGSDEDTLVVFAVLDLMVSGKIGWKNKASRSGIKRVFHPEKKGTAYALSSSIDI